LFGLTDDDKKLQAAGYHNVTDHAFLPGRLADIHSRIENNKLAVANYYDKREFGRAVRAIIEITELANQFVDHYKPWELAKDGDNRESLHLICSVLINAFHSITGLLAPIAPRNAQLVEEFLQVPPIRWESIGCLLSDHRIQPFKHLITRVDAKQITALIAANTESLQPAPQSHSPQRQAQHQSTHPSPSGRGAGGEGPATRKVPLPPDLLDFARKLRREQTDAEQLIWTLLRDRRLANAKFRRQHPVEAGGRSYVLDFYCHDLKLAIELDGGQHHEQRHIDAQRTQALAGIGIRVLRFWNNDVLSQADTVLESIWNTVNEMTPSTPTPSPPTPLPGGEGLITIDDFAKVDLRVARIVNAEHVEGADKLLKLTLDIGAETRQVFAGIKSAYDPDKLKGRLTVMVANLQPRKMRFGESQGMVLAASGEAAGIFLLSPDDGAQPGMKVK